MVDTVAWNLVELTNIQNVVLAIIVTLPLPLQLHYITVLQQQVVSLVQTMIQLLSHVLLKSLQPLLWQLHMVFVL